MTSLRDELQTKTDAARTLTCRPFDFEESKPSLCFFYQEIRDMLKASSERRKMKSKTNNISGLLRENKKSHLRPLIFC